MNSGPNWARRYGPTRRLCARPGCGSPAAATLRFQPTQREAWLVELDDDAARTEGDLCARHAAGLVLPRGWQLHDALATPLRITPEPAPAAPPRRARTTSIARARRRRTATAAVELPGLAAVGDTDDGDGDDGGGTQREPEDPRSRSHERAPLVAAATPEASEALAESLDVRTPLLRRAFSNVWLPDANPPPAVDENTAP
jgi:Protein of unknown function (DUF3499)